VIIRLYPSVNNTTGITTGRYPEKCRGSAPREPTTVAFHGNIASGRHPNTLSRSKSNLVLWGFRFFVGGWMRFQSEEVARPTVFRTDKVPGKNLWLDWKIKIYFPRRGLNPLLSRAGSSKSKISEKNIWFYHQVPILIEPYYQLPWYSRRMHSFDVADKLIFHNKPRYYYLDNFSVLPSLIN